MDNSDLSELIIEADFLWREIGIGDFVQIEDAIFDQGVELLTPGTEYMVLVRQKSATGLQSFVTESNIEGRTAVIYPHLICNYTCTGNQALS
ncbi:hypothetical protein [Motiliproteus sp. MSK22-1]|uniref:hypothetical protein n=1 Tax=Motiliproteus sp. MSK22-1 TaxID=1897630 RepID=UPI00097795B4|nr:hypothetical protein [Motiliproteus sp. MSK22-1]OMH39230.1 hypothetical protein BGP75_03805 [Motiliproteus sp. MSK22-1]